MPGFAYHGAGVAISFIILALSMGNFFLMHSSNLLFLLNFAVRVSVSSASDRMIHK